MERLRPLHFMTHIALTRLTNNKGRQKLGHAYNI